MVVKINNKSDFKINEWSESIALEVPFEFSYYIPLNKEKYVASFDGHKYINCTRLEDGSLDVIFNSHGLGIGRLKVVRKYYVDDSSFADGVFDVTSDDLTDVFLTSGKTFDTYVRTLVVPPYLKGDKGDPMTWNSMTDKERGELVEDIAEAIDPEMVMTENEKSRQEAERSRQTAEQQRSTTFNTLKGEMQSAITAGNAAAGNAQKVVDEYDTKVAEQDSKLSELGQKVDALATDYVYLDAPLSGSIKKSSYTPEFAEAIKWIKRVEYKNVVDYGKLVSAYISYISIEYNYGAYRMEVNYDKKYYFKGFNSTDVGKENILSFVFDDGSGIDVVIERPYVGDSSYSKNADVRNERIGFVQTEKKDEKIKLNSPFFGEIPIKDYNINIHHAISSILSVKYVNVVDFDKLKELYINYVGFIDDAGNAKRINVELVYDSKPYVKGITYVSMDGYSPLSYEFDDGTVIELLLRYPREGLVAFVDIRNYKIRLTQDSFKNGVLEGNNDDSSDSDNTNNNGCSLSLITNAIGNPISRNFSRDNSSKTPVNQVITNNDGFYNITFTRTGAGYVGIWNALTIDLKANHRYILISKYRYNSNARFKNRLTYYITKLGFVLNGALICDDESDFGYWKYSLNNGNNVFVAAEDKTYTLDVVFSFNDTETANEVILDIDLCPILIDITDVDINSFGLISIFEKYGVIFNSMAIANVGLNPVNSIVRENMVCLGDSTTGMMMWQDKLAKIKGWEWDSRTNGGIEIDGIQRAAMGVGSTWVEPIITGTTGGGKGQSHYMRAKDAKYYKPSVFFVMSSYNGAHAGGHWGNNENYPTQKEDYGIDDAPYKGEEIDLTVNPNAEVPSFGASYYGMIEQLIEDLPNTQIVLLNLCTDFAGANIERIEKKNAVIKKAAETYNLLLLDVNKEAGFNKINRYILRYNGGVHFNDAGGMRLAKFIASKL